MLNHGSLVKGITLVFIGASIGVAGTLWVDSQSDTTLSPLDDESESTAAEPNRFDEVIHEIRELRQVLRTESPVVRDLVNDESKLVAPESEGALQRLSVIEELLERIDGRISAARGTHGRTARFPKNTASLGSLLGSNSTLQTQDHFCWTPSSIYEKYGVPDTPHWSPAKMEWRYQIAEHKVIFTFAQGVVIDVTIW